jgi:hypothetical protein
VFGANVLDLQEDGHEGSAGFVLGFQETHPHVICVLVNDEHVIAKATRGRDIDMAPNVAGHVHEGVTMVSCKRLCCGERRELCA